VRATDECLDREKRTEVRSESSQSYDAGVYGLPSPWIMDLTGGIFPSVISPVMPYFPYAADVGQIHPSPWVMNRSIGIPRPSIPPLYPYCPHMVDAGQRYTYTYTRRTGSGYSATRPNILIRASTGSFDLSDEGQTPLIEDE
jgi:hypothetical protein